MDKTIKLRIAKVYIFARLFKIIFLFTGLFIVFSLFLDIEHLFNFLSLNEELTIDAGVFLLTLIFLCLLSLISLVGQSTEYFLLSRGELRHKKGVFSLKLKVQKLEKIESITIKQAIWEKLFNCGSIEMTSALINEKITIPYIQEPESILKIIEQFIKDEGENDIIIHE